MFRLCQVKKRILYAPLRRLFNKSGVSPKERISDDCPDKVIANTQTDRECPDICSYHLVVDNWVDVHNEIAEEEHYVPPQKEKLNDNEPQLINEVVSTDDECVIVKGTTNEKDADMLKVDSEIDVVPELSNNLGNSGVNRLANRKWVSRNVNSTILFF